MAEDNRIQELLDEYGSVLTQWEQEFLDSLDEWEGDLTAAQEEKLDDVYSRVALRRRGR